MDNEDIKLKLSQIAKESNLSKDKFNEILASYIVDSRKEELELQKIEMAEKIKEIRQKAPKEYKIETINNLYNDVKGMLINTHSMARVKRITAMQFIRFSDNMDGDITSLLLRVMSMYSNKYQIDFYDNKLSIFTLEQQKDLKAYAKDVLISAKNLKMENSKKELY